MRYRRLIAGLLVGLTLVGIGAVVTGIRSIAPLALARHVSQTGGAGAGIGAAPPPVLEEHEQRPRNMRDLAQNIMRISGREQGEYKPIEIIRIGERDYLILIAGTQLDSEGGNNLESAIQEVTKQSSPYLRQIRAQIARRIPPGSNVHLAGHSLGGMVANVLATVPELLERYNVKTVTTFAAPVNACPNPDVVYHRYVVEGDLIPLLHWAAIWSRIRGPLLVLKSTCVEGYDYLRQTLVDHSPGPSGMKNAHSSYEYSRDLLREPLPFPIDRYESMGRFGAEP